MAIRQKEKTNKFLEITDPKKAVGLWSYYTVRETAMTPVGATKEALGRFLPQDVARWKRREEMAAAMEAGRRAPGARTKFKSPARIIAEYQEKAKQDTKRLKITEWQMKYRWLHLWERYACRLAAPSIVAGEKDTQMFFGLASAGVCCHEGNLHGGRVFFLRKKTQVKVEGEGEQRKFNYFVAVVLKPGGTKWWWSLERVNVTWTTNTYDRLIIDPRGKLEWSPMDAEVLTERVVEKDVCLFQLEDDALFAAITDNELNPGEKYAHLCYDFDFFCRNPEGKANDFYMRWSVFFNPKKSKFNLVAKSRPRVIEVMGERKKGWIARPLAVSDEFGVKREELSAAGFKNGKRKPVSMDREAAKKIRTSDAKLGLGDTPLDRYAQEVAHWVVENNGCAVLPVGVSREMRLALSHALFFVTFPDRRPDEEGGILRGYQLPGRLVEHAPGKVRGDNGKALKERSQKQSEEATARRRKMVVDCLFARACAAVLNRNRNVLDEKGVVDKMDEIGARRIVEKAAWQRGFMEGNPLMLFRPSPTAGNLKLPDLSLALGFEHLLGLKGETAGAADLLVQTAPIRSLRESQGPIRESFADAYPCQSLWAPAPGKEKGAVAYPSDSVRILRDEGRYYLMAMPKYALYRYERDLVFEPDVPGKARPSNQHQAPSTKPPSVSVDAYSFKSVGGKRSRADSFIVEEKFDYNKVTKLAREGRLLLYAIDFGQDKWLADIVFSKENKQPCKIIPTIPILAPEGTEKKNAFEEGRKSGTDVVTKVALTSETAQAFITFTFNPTVARDNRKVEGRSWRSYLDAFPAEERRHIVRLVDCSIEGLRAALQEVIETDGVLLTDKEHIDEAIRVATYVVKGDPYNGYNLKDRIFYGEAREPGSRETASVRQQEDRRKELKGKPLCEVLSPDLAREAEAEFTRQIEADTLVDAKTPKTFKLDEPIKVGEDFKDAVAREFRRISYTGTMGWRQKLNRPAHEVAVGIWLAGLN